jgi:hypothetical protein
VSLASAEDLSAGVPLAIQKGETTTMSDVTIVATGLGFPEGPVACADGSIVLTEIRNNRCSRVTRDGQVSLFSATGGGPNGLAIGPDGAFYLCNNGGSRYVEGTSMGQGPHPDYNAFGVKRVVPAVIGRQPPQPRQHAQAFEAELLHAAAQLPHPRHGPTDVDGRHAYDMPWMGPDCGRHFVVRDHRTGRPPPGARDKPA